jgi:multiple sugar transport system substrate-binding protein
LLVKNWKELYLNTRTVTSMERLRPLLNSSASQEKATDYIDGLWGVARTPDGSTYGIVVDCNPLILWYNKGILQNAGISQMPADLYEQGKWNRDAFTNMIQQIKAKGKYGYILDHWTLPFWSWVTASGGKVYDNNGRGQFIANQDPKSVDTFKWLNDNIRAKTIIYASSLPKGQGADLAFLTNQVGFVCAGRWYLPEFKKADNLQYDIVPFPTNTGKKIEPAGVAIAYISLNNASKNRDAAFQFLTNFVSAKGETFRLQNGGNALPSIHGADQVVTEGNLPAHAQYFIDAREIGYAPFVAEDATTGLTNDIQDKLDPMWLQGADVQSTLNAVAAMANPRIKQALASH